MENSSPHHMRIHIVFICVKRTLTYILKIPLRYLTYLIDVRFKRDCLLV